MSMTIRTYGLSIEQHPDVIWHISLRLRMQPLGQTYEEAVRNAEERLAAVYLEGPDELGKPIPEENDVKQAVSLGVTVRMPVIA